MYKSSEYAYSKRVYAFFLVFATLFVSVAFTGLQMTNEADDSESEQCQSTTTALWPFVMAGFGDLLTNAAIMYLFVKVEHCVLFDTYT